MAERSSRRLCRWLGGLGALLMIWSIAGAPSSVSQEVEVVEPEDLTAYATFGDAMPVQLYFDHQLRLIPLGPALAHSQTEVSLPSAASGIAWLLDGGVANGLHGTSTGNRVPTEASAKQPGGDPRAEFSVAGGPIGAPEFASVRAGRAFASAEHSDEPNGYANAFFFNLAILPAAGSPGDPPGTYDPDGTFPGGENGAPEPDTAPRGQMAILSIGKIASTSQSFRSESSIRSIGVAELSDINIGNRTSDGRCTNCIRLDHLRVEAFAEANGRNGGAKAAYRVTAGRWCRRGFNAEEGHEEDRCFPLNPRDREGTKGLQSIDELERLNAQLAKPFWTTVTNGAVGYTIGVRIHLGSHHREDARARRTSSPPDDPERNYATASKDGQGAKAVAEGLDLEIWTITSAQIADDVARRADPLIGAVDQDHSQPGIQVGDQTIPADTVVAVRRMQLTLGVARATATARPGISAPGVPTGGEPPEVGGLRIGPEAPAGSPQVSVTGGGAPALGGNLKLRINWASLRVRPWKPYDTLKGIASVAIAAGVWLLARRRFAPG